MKQFAEIQKSVHIYLIDLKSFALTLKDDGYEDANIKGIILNTEKLYNLLNNSTSKLNKDKLSKQIKLAEELANKILSELKFLKCKDELIFEKANLIVGIFSIKEKIDSLFI